MNAMTQNIAAKKKHHRRITYNRVGENALTNANHPKGESEYIAGRTAGLCLL